MTSDITTACLPQSETETSGPLFDNWFDPIEAVLRDRAREFLQAMLGSRARRGGGALALRPAREGAERRFDGGAGRHRSHGHGHRTRALLGTFGQVKVAERKSRVLRAYQRRTLAA
jgi:putative transposase